MRNGIIMEEHKHYYIVMTRDGEFLKVKKIKEYQIGEEISFTTSQEEKASLGQKLFARKIPQFSMALVLLLAVIPLLTNLNTGKAYAYVTIDINPSIEMSIDDKQTVTDMRAYNDDGRKIVRSIDDWRGKTLTDVTEEIIDQSEQNGYLKNERDVMISITHINKKNKTIDEQIEKTIHMIEQKTKLAVTMIEISKRTHDEAKKLGVSPNKLAIAENNGVPIEKVKEKSVAEIKKMFGNLTEKDKQMEHKEQQTNHNKRKVKEENENKTQGEYGRKEIEKEKPKVPNKHLEKEQKKVLKPEEKRKQLDKQEKANSEQENHKQPEEQSKTEREEEKPKPLEKQEKAPKEEKREEQQQKKKDED
ncbi:anti-sigma factor domain-containing protein [Anoxybacteroides amylolyticum]|uniref:Anti-sigma factor family protein n=1 Tax=Anoxybacteroides amylolyticum TaxID=294699 RepID=A0A160F720_9BACL|nr:anti-sigma factor domain-containing protein [Anoxybacillus amylolyticus]ANB61992.1 anti-sigma factor family protein [Anoxybacillus amylolyticus]